MASRGRRPFEGAAIPDTPESCTDFWRPSKDCVRDLMEQTAGDDGLVAFGGGKLKFESGGCQDWMKQYLREGSWDAYTLASRVSSLNAPVRQHIWRTYIGPDFSDWLGRIMDPKKKCKIVREGKRIGGYAWTYTGWFGWEYHYIAMCDTYYTLDTLKVKLGITEADLRIGNTKYAKEAVYQKHLGLYFLHEMMHLDSVGIPHINDEKVSNETTTTAYGPDLVHKLARGRPIDGGGAARASTNADSYAWLANSLYFYEMTGYAPKPPGYRGTRISSEESDAQPPVGLHLGVVNQDVAEEDFDARYEEALEGIAAPGPQVILPNPDGLPKPECATKGTTFAASDVEQHLYEFCSGNEDFWDTVIVPPITTGTGRTSDGKTKAIGVSQGWAIDGADEKFWVGVMFSRDTCQGYYTFGGGGNSQEKLGHCWERLRAVLHGCQTDTRSEKMGGELSETCAVYSVTVAKDDPFEHSRWYRDEGDLECENTGEGTDVELPGLENTCTCWFSGYPGLTDVFKKTGDSCDASEVNLADLVLGP